MSKELARLGTRQNPWRRVIFVGVISVLVAAFDPFGVAVAVSSFGTLLYYSVTNLSVLRLSAQQRNLPRGLSVVGVVACLTLAFGFRPQGILIGLAVLFSGIVFRTLRLQIRKRNM